MSKLIFLIFLLSVNFSSCNAGTCIKNKNASTKKEQPLFEYNGVIKKMHSNFNICDSLLSIYVENEVQDLASKGYEGRFIIKAKLLISKDGKVKRVAIFDKYKGMNAIYAEVSDALKKATFRPCMFNNSPKKTIIVSLLIIDTYQFPSKISKVVFGRR
jgi:hypothetical protein